ncbi:MAG: cupredoxin family copper-binding protein [Pseudomonadota bacterium]
MSATTRRKFLMITLIGGAFGALTGRAQAATHVVQIKGFTFQPARLEIAAGDSVTFVNADGSAHTATGRGFDTGRLARGQQASLTFDRPGSYDYICEVHPAMRGRITVR